MFFVAVGHKYFLQKVFGSFQQSFPGYLQVMHKLSTRLCFGWMDVYVVACFTQRGEVDIMRRLIWIQPILQKAYKF